MATRSLQSLLGMASEVFAPRQPDAPTAQTVADRLRAARRHRFVGRVAELEVFRQALEVSPPPFTVLFVHGPGGVGKTTLLERFAELAVGAGFATTRLDLSAIEPSPAALLRELAREVGLPAERDPLDVLARGQRRS